MNTFGRQVAIAGAFAFALAWGTPVFAGQARLFLQGTWTGDITCKGINGGVKEKFKQVATMRMAQSGAIDIGFEVDFGGGKIVRYAGLSNPDAKKPEKKGEMAIVRCGTDDQVGVLADDELGRMTISSKLGDPKASFKGSTILAGFSDPGPQPAKGYTCKWKFKRTTFDGADAVQVSCAP